MLILTIVVLAVIAALVVAFAGALAWAQLHARPANSLPAPIGNASRPKRRPF
jgi:hypothetical protein